jgi:hypothetical protein
LGVPLPIKLLNIWLLLVIAKNFFLLRRGLWTSSLRWAEFGLGVLGAALLGLMLVNAVAAFQEISLASVLGHEALGNLLTRVIPATLGLILVLVIIASAKRLYRLLRNRPSQT